MPDYRAIYNDVISREQNYNLAQHSPGYQNCVEYSQSLSLLSGRCLDIGCGVGFVLEYLSAAPFRFEIHGIDVSDLAIHRAKDRLAHLPRANDDHLKVMVGQSIPFDDDYFSLVTCFDVFEHLDPPDISTTFAEIQRVIRRGGLFFGSVSCRPSGAIDLEGENLHRTVRGVDWWIGQVEPDRVTWDSARNQLLVWKRYFKRA